MEVYPEIELDDEMRFKLLEIHNLKNQIKELESSIEAGKKVLIYCMEKGGIKRIELSDGIFIDFRQGTSYHSISYKDIVNKYPHLIPEIRPITKIVQRNPTIVITTKEE
jgi:hypothetical protein